MVNRAELATLAAVALALLLVVLWWLRWWLREGRSKRDRAESELVPLASARDDSALLARLGLARLQAAVDALAPDDASEAAGERHADGHLLLRPSEAESEPARRSIVGMRVVDAMGAVLRDKPVLQPADLRAAVDVAFEPPARAEIWRHALFVTEDDVAAAGEALLAASPGPEQGPEHQPELFELDCERLTEVEAPPESRPDVVRVLRAWTRLNPTLVYKQGLHELVAVVVGVCAAPPLALALVQAMTRRYLRRHLSAADDGEDQAAHFASLMQLLAFVDPPLYVHVRRLELDPALFAVPWVTTLWADCLPCEDLVHVWDRLFALGAGFRPAFAAALLQAVREDLLGGDVTAALMLFSALNGQERRVNVHWCLARAALSMAQLPSAATTSVSPTLEARLAATAARSAAVQWGPVGPRGEFGQAHPPDVLHVSLADFAVSGALGASGGEDTAVVVDLRPRRSPKLQPAPACPVLRFASRAPTAHNAERAAFSAKLSRHRGKYIGVLAGTPTVALCAVAHLLERRFRRVVVVVPGSGGGGPTGGAGGDVGVGDVGVGDVEEGGVADSSTSERVAL